MRNQILSLLVLVLTALFGESVIARDFSEAEKEVVENGVKDELKDPESARFKWVPVLDGEPSFYCGMVNAKNSYGGYTGDVPFTVFIVWIEGEVKDAGIIGLGTTDPGSARSLATYQQCEKHGYDKLYLAE